MRREVPCSVCLFAMAIRHSNTFPGAAACGFSGEAFQVQYTETIAFACCVALKQQPPWTESLLTGREAQPCSFILCPSVFCELQGELCPQRIGSMTSTIVWRSFLRSLGHMEGLQIHPVTLNMIVHIPVIPLFKRKKALRAADQGCLATVAQGESSGPTRQGMRGDTYTSLGKPYMSGVLGINLPPARTRYPEEINNHESSRGHNLFASPVSSLLECVPRPRPERRLST